jgi:pyruvate/2-oxoglutarate dehydrogenase complex dihydrolipoamide dehydrogenase (E3) component
MCGRLAVRNAESQMDLLKSFKVDYAQGVAAVTADGVSIKSVSDDATKTIKSPYVLLATGSKATRFDGIPFDDVRVFEADSIAKLAFLPDSVLIQGSGIVAIEFAMIFSHLGAKVTMMVRGDVLSSLTRVGIDHDIAVHLVDSCHECGINIMEVQSINSTLVQSINSALVQSINSALYTVLRYSLDNQPHPLPGVFARVICSGRYHRRHN